VNSRQAAVNSSIDLLGDLALQAVRFFMLRDQQNFQASA